MIRRPHTSRAFTLIELVLVMLIIGLLLAIVAPSLTGLLQSQKIDQAGRTIAAMLGEARSRAAADAKPYRLVIDTEDSTCWLEVLTTEGFKRPQSTVGQIVELEKEFTIELEGGTKESSMLMVRVEPDGTGELAQVTLTRKQDKKQIAVACKTPTEPYIVGKPMTPQQLETGVDDVQTK